MKTHLSINTLQLSDSSAPSQVYGVDFGGTGIKAALVDTREGSLLSERLRIPTPKPATPGAVAQTIQELCDLHSVPQDIPFGVAMPSVIHHGVAKSAANISPEWIDFAVADFFSQELGRPVSVLNDADAAGVAEMAYGAGQGENGTVMLFTLGTGIGSALMIDGLLVPNTELGHLEIDGRDAETHAAQSAKERDDLDFVQWAERLQRYFDHIEELFSPDLIIIGGGISKAHTEFLPLLDVNARLVPAQLRNNAGIIGAGLAARFS